ncbi:MAG: NTP transferase domain-containing protein [Candidatus Omnitrophota bacterium]
MKELRSIVLAAGKGTRMKSQLAKVLHPVCGRPMVQYVIDVVKGAGSLKNYVVLSHQFEAVKQILGENEIPVKQEQLLGTADAVRSVESFLKGYADDLLVVCGDTPLLTVETVKALVKKHQQTGASCTILTAVLSNSTGYGRIIRGMDGRSIAIREEKDASADEKKIMEINVGVYCFKAASLFKALPGIKKNRLKKEFYLTDVIEIMAERKWKIETLETSDPQEGWGINSKVDLASAEKVMQLKILTKFMRDGITIIDPGTTYIDANVKIGADTVIKPFTVIESDVRIGRNCVIGPFARLRPKTVILNNTEIGNFTEISRTKIGNNVFMKHFSFLGDAVVGDQANIGAGTVTANFDGKNKHQTKIGKQAFIGSDSVIVAPATIGKGAVVGAGCVVAKEKIVPDGHVMVGVPGRVIGKRKQ